MQLTTIVAAVPADGWSDIQKFLPGGPNFAPFMSLAGIVSAIGALILAAISIISVIGVLWNGMRWAGGAITGSPVVVKEAKSGLKTSALWLLVSGVLWGVIITFIVNAGRTVT